MDRKHGGMLQLWMCRLWKDIDGNGKCKNTRGEGAQRKKINGH